ncbi:hypothetical protein GCM10022252_45690 [Streptosporangium oxazolinicum]|uniref:Uncharacterized protein n=1 Tax=Streptosporangium oxazolinicum TaxID=909287 RepID=A0ABP8B414_9ACTN
MGWRLLNRGALSDGLRGFIEIRATTHIVRREAQGEGFGDPIGRIDRIRMIIDICHTLPANFRPTPGRLQAGK